MLSEVAVESPVTGIPEAALSNWRAVLYGHGVRVAGAWRGCCKAATCDLNPLPPETTRLGLNLEP